METSPYIDREDNLTDYLETCTGQLIKVIYHSRETGYCVLKLQSKKEKFTAVGKTTTTLQEGFEYRLTGNWTEHLKYGRQFSFKTCILQCKTDKKSILEYLSSGLIKGIGPSLAREIVNKFGSKTFKILDEEPERLLEVKGIGKAKLAQIKKSWKQTRGLQFLYEFLIQYDISLVYAEKLYQKYKEDAVDMIKENPYRLIYDIKGIGFKKADAIAKNLGFEKEDPRRIKAGIYYVLKQGINDGHCFLPSEKLLTQTQEELEIEKNKIEPILEKQVKEQELIQEENRIYLPAFYVMENYTGEKIKQLIEENKYKENKHDQKDILKDITIIEKQTGITLTKEQKQAVVNAFTTSISVLTGGPGTGKTQTIRFVIEVAKKRGMVVKLAAPTGIASDRLQSVARHPASTIHRLLEYNPSIGFQRNEKNPIETNLLIIDESSMIDLPLAYNLFKAIPLSCHVVFVGDVNQLPSVGPGLILKNMINSGTIAVTRLTKIFRQAEKSLIVKNAHRVLAGQPIIHHGNGFDFFHEEEPEKILKMLKQTLEKLLSLGIDPYTDIQVISPGKKGLLGTNNLNKELKEIINPSSSSDKVSISFLSRTFTEGDKVMQIRNNYDKGVFNGNIGRIEWIDPEEGILSVRYPELSNSVLYTKMELDELVHAYACTVHKYQGSEVDYVLMPLHFSHYILLQRNLFYTALTRCKKHFYLFGQKKAVYVAIKRNKPTRRYTNLEKIIKRKIAEENMFTSEPFSESPSFQTETEKKKKKKWLFANYSKTKKSNIIVATS